jgi:hypothetical protein
MEYRCGHDTAFPAKTRNPSTMQLRSDGLHAGGFARVT